MSSSPLRDGTNGLNQGYDDGVDRLYDDDNDEEDEALLGSPSRELEDPTDRYELFLPAVQALVAALGGYEQVETGPGSGEFETIYRPGDSVLAVLKDLKKLWRKDDEDDERTVARCMAKAGLMRELVAILVECTDRGDWGRKVALVACDLIAALTWPIDVASELKEMEDEPDVVTDYASLLRAQVEYKATILQSNGPLRCLLVLMLPSLAKPRKDEKDQRVISLGLHVVRNLLAIKDTVAEGTAIGEKEEFANLQSNLILQLNKLTYFQLVLTLASCADKTDFNPFNVLVLDILHLAFRSVKPVDLGRDQAKAPAENLAKLLDAEKRQKALVSKVGMTRHSRFGTTVAVRAGEQKVILHKQNAISANAGKILDEVKRKRKQKTKRVDDLTHIVNLSPDAMRVLQTLAKSFIQSCFNTFFASILKDIRMERSKIRPTDNLRTFFLSRFFIEYLLILHEKEAAQGAKKHELALGFVAEMVEMDNIRWLFYRLKSAMDDKPPAWTELQASLDCFTQILLLLDEMAASKNQDDVDVAEIVQNNLYYNGDILDSSLSVISQYKDQSVAYLDSVIHFAYVLLRMLEKFSKNKAFMFIRKKKAARKKRQQNQQDPTESSGMPEEYGNEEEEALGGADQDAPSYAEHAFTFQAFEKRFASESVTNTLLSYLARFQEFEEPEQMKRVVGLMHRQVIKAQAEGLYFKVSTLDLFRRILDESHTLIKADSSKDLMQLINFVLRKFFKRVAEDPFLIVEAFTSKSRSRWKDLSSYKSEDEDDDGMGGQRARIKEKMGLAELEFKKNKNLSWSQQMEVAFSLILKEEHEDWIKWIIEELEVALAARTEIVLSIDGEEALITHNEDDVDDEDGGEGARRNFGGPSKEAIEKFAQHNLKTENEQLRTAVTKNAHFRLMLKLLSFDMVRPSDEALAAEPSGPLYSEWYLPSTVLPSNIATSLGALKQYLENPPHLAGDPKDLLRRARAPKARKARSPSLSEMDLDSETGELVRRVKKARKRKTKAAEMQTFKSAAFIEDSDDEDESVSARFFEREQQLREEMKRLAEEQGNVMRRHGTKRKRAKKGKGKEEDADAEGGGMEVDVAGSDDEGDDESDSGMRVMQAGGLSQNVSDDEGGEGDVDAADGSESEDDQLPPRPRKRQSLAPSDINLTQDESGDESDESDKRDTPPPPPASSSYRVNGKARRVVDSDEDE
ncbi:hypothetical protein IAT40_000170 [Kwoniella sp. CBS 6097]